MEDAGVMETVEPVEIESSGGESSGEVSQETQQSQQPENPYEPKSSRAYSEWLKGAKEKFGDDPNANKFLRLSKDNHARMYQVQQMEPKGIDGIREKYAMLDSVVWDDPQKGQLKGTEAIAAIQDRVQEYADIDRRLAAGDPSALETLGEDFNEGLAKLTPTILDRIRESNPDAYAAAVLPHFVEALKSSELVASFNGLVDVLNEAPPSWLTADQKSQWTQDRLQRVMGLAGKMGSWFNAQQAKAGELPGKNPVTTRSQPGKEDTELETLRKEGETTHWKTNIDPKLNEHADKKFDELFRPYAKRLRLDAAATADLKEHFVRGVSKKSAANPAYMSQINRYHTQKKPDPGTVVNLAKVEFDKHAKSMMEGLVNQRYKSFLTSKPATTPTTTGKPGVKPAVGVQIVTVKPQNIDYRRTTPEMIHNKKYWTTDNKLVQVQR